MTRNDDLSDRQTDPIAERLRQNALANRPAFSPELHRRILQHVRADASSGKLRSLVRYRSRIAAIAALLLICAWLGLRLSRPVPNLKVAHNVDIPAEKPQPIVVDDPAIPIDLHIKGLLSATLWPPEIQVELPIDLPVSQSPADDTVVEAAPRGLPQVLLDAMQQETGDADTALAGVIPANLRSLFVKVPQSDN